MPENEEPIFDFAPLKNFLKERGYNIGTRDAYGKINPEEVKAADVTNGSMSFTSEGIFVKDAEGHEHQVFLYKKDYHLEKYGKPRFHICKCRVIEDFINSGGFNAHYVRANSEPVPVKNLDDFRTKVEVDALPLCSYCSKMLGDFEDSSEFIETLKSANQTAQEDLEVDLFGYVRNWEQLSKAYREKQHYKCEKCGLEINNDYDKQYIHVHHVDGDKLNNHEENLRCYCLYCHSNVDDHHKKRLRTGANRYIFNDFLDKYAEKASWGNMDEDFKTAYKEACSRISNEEKISEKAIAKLYPLSPTRLITKLVDNGIATYSKGMIYLK